MEEEEVWGCKIIYLGVYLINLNNLGTRFKLAENLEIKTNN